MKITLKMYVLSNFIHELMIKVFMLVVLIQSQYHKKLDDYGTCKVA